MILAVALSSAVGALALIVILFLFLRYCILRQHRGTSRMSETSSSAPSLQAGQDIEFSVQRGGPYPSGLQGARHFGLEELNLATRNFNDINLIGRGSFGEAYKGLLQDGTIVAIKRRLATPSQVFVEEMLICR
ncbi:hypothetical protein HPP92_025007 [Vanilla planifolia]|uniref:non-specific serine/threonine protein kinase n=1 Tax=Vanilla planifolia TaxID=51239 RepID=A0A835PJ97_VANPL|nr:hypothetical protein HPP92_025007 [Vanilla planifolia]